MKFLKKRDEVEIDAFEFRHMKDIQTDTNTIKRQTFTDEEYRLLYKYLYKNYIAKSLKLDERQLAFRQLIRHWILISANSGMRSGEQRQLKWSDVELEDVKDEKGKTITLAKITIRKETTKVKKARVFHCRCGEQFKRLRELQTHRVNDGLVFSTNGVSELDKSVLNKEWKKIMEEVGIQNYRERKIVPYSLRHYCITKRIESGKTLMNVAQMCGTSVAQIERTYYHLQTEVSRQTALG
jgi:integrase